MTPDKVPDISSRVEPPSRPRARSRPPISSPRTSRRGSLPSSVAPAIAFSRIGPRFCVACGSRRTRPCGRVRVNSSAWKLFGVTLNLVWPNTSPVSHGSITRADSNSRSTSIAGPGVTFPLAKRFPSAMVLSFRRKVSSPYPLNRRTPPSPGTRLKRTPLAAKSPWGRATRSRASVSDKSSMSNNRVSGVRSSGPFVSRNRGRSKTSPLASTCRIQGPP